MICRQHTLIERRKRQFSGNIDVIVICPQQLFVLFIGGHTFSSHCIGVKPSAAAGSQCVMSTVVHSGHLFTTQNTFNVLCCGKFATTQHIKSAVL